MTEQTVQRVPSPRSVAERKNGKPRPGAIQQKLSPPPVPDGPQEIARKLVVENYNEHRPPAKREFGLDTVYVLWFTKWGDDWTAIVCSTIIRSFCWFVFFDGATGKVTIQVFQKVRSITKQIAKPAGSHIPNQEES